MVISLQDFDSREDELLKEATQLRARLAQIDGLLKRVREARQTVAELWFEDPESARPATGNGQHAEGEGAEATTRKTVRESIVGVLQVGALWQAAVIIRGRISQTEGRDIPMSSLSPTLTKMKKDNEIVRQGSKMVALRSRVEIEEPGFFNENGEAFASPENDEDRESSPRQDIPGVTPSRPAA